MDHEVTKIDAQELDEARRDPKKLLQEADEYLREQVAHLKPGPPEGARMEHRPVGGKMVKDVPCVGEHAHDCRRTDEGWVCSSGCAVVDRPVMPNIVLTNDILTDVEHEVYRRRLRVYWISVRVNQRLTFRNGRCSPAEQVHRRDVWYEGRAWTKRGARRQIRRAEGQR